MLGQGIRGSRIGSLLYFETMGEGDCEDPLIEPRESEKPSGKLVNPLWRGATKHSVSGRVPPVASWVSLSYDTTTTTTMLPLLVLGMPALRPEGRRVTQRTTPPLARATKSVGAPGSGWNWPRI
jgi:hypothetical protein